MLENIIQLQSRLEQAPDDYLSKEITKPSGRIPVSLVFNEIQRRRSMRDSAMAKAKGNIMGLQDGGGIQTLMAGPEQMPQTLPAMPEEKSFLEFLQELIKRNQRDDNPEDSYLASQSQMKKGENQKKGQAAKFDPSWVGKTSPEAAAATLEAHKKNNEGLVGSHTTGFTREELEALQDATEGNSGGNTGIGTLPSSSGSDSFFKALQDEMNQFGPNQKQYMDSLQKNRAEYTKALQNDPYADIIKQQQAENSKEQKWGIPLMALASGILGGRNLAQGLSQGSANMIPVLQQQEQEKKEGLRRLQELMLGQGQMKRGDAKDIYSISNDEAKTGYSMYGDKLNMATKMAELGLNKERNDINRAEVAARAAYYQSGGSKNPLTGYLGILKLDTSTMSPEAAAKVERLQATILSKIFGMEDEEAVQGPDEFGVGIGED